MRNKTIDDVKTVSYHEDMKKTTLIQVRVTEEEKQEFLKQMARENFSNLSEFIRKVVLDRIKK